MTVEFALDIIPRRMRELGYDKYYITRWKHLQIDGGATLKIESYNEFYFLITPSGNFRVKSKMGIYDETDPAINEMQYEHRGKIEISNLNDTSKLILFIQVIPNHS